MIFKKPPKDFSFRTEVVSCFCECGGKIVLLHRQDHKQYGNTWGPPAGKVNQEETLLEAIVRELKEESGLMVNHSQLNYFGKYFVRYPEFDFVFHIFHLILKDLPEIKIRPEEHKAFAWLTPQESLEITLIRDQDEFVRLFFKLAR